MSIHDNSPGLTYIRIEGAIVTYNGNCYNVMNFDTCKKFIYWDADNPYKFKDSNTMLPISQQLRLVVINNFGVNTVYPSETDNFIITFDGDSKKNIDKKIYGLYEKDVINGERFTAIETDVTGIKNTVGSTIELKGTLVENITQLHQKDDEINLSVSKHTKELKDNKLRDEVNASIIKLSSDLGLFQSKISEYFRDDKITQLEKDEITSQYKILDTDKTKVYAELDKVLAIVDANNDTTGRLNIENAKTALDDAHKNLQTIITNAIADNVITPSDKTLVLNGFAQYNLLKNQLKNTVDNLIILGMGGTISEEISSIRMQSNEISLSVQETEKNIKSELSIMSGLISSKVTAGEVYSIIEQSPDAVKTSFNGISAEVVIDRTGLTVNNGRIKTDALIPGSDSRIVLEPGYYWGNGQDRNDIRSIDANSGDIRLKYDKDSYISVSDNTISFYVNSGYTPVMSIGSNGLIGYTKYFNEVGNYWKIGDYKNGSSLVCQYPGTGIRIKSGASDAYASIGVNESQAWLYQGSDIRLKENVHYLKEENLETENKMSTLSLSDDYVKSILYPLDNNKDDNILLYNKETYNNKNISRKDLYDFVKNDLKLCEYNYIGNEDANLNFIAQDIANTKVGSFFVTRDESDYLGYKLNHNYISVIIGALQYEISQRERLEKELIIIKNSLKN